MPCYGLAKAISSRCCRLSTGLRFHVLLGGFRLYMAIAMCRCRATAHSRQHHRDVAAGSRCCSTEANSCESAAQLGWLPSTFVTRSAIQPSQGAACTSALASRKARAEPAATHRIGPQELKARRDKRREGPSLRRRSISERRQKSLLAKMNKNNVHRTTVNC